MSDAARRRLRIARRALGGAALRLAGPGAVALLARTWRVETLGAEHRDEAFGAPACVLVLWHGRLLLPLARHRGEGFSVLVSPSDDGSLVAPVLARYGQTVVRGSTNETPARALRRLAQELERGRRVVLTPDGPRGPRHAANLGAAWLARRSGLPVLPYGLACDRAWRFASWDRFTVPKPLARVALVFGPPLRVSARANDEGLARATAELRRRILAAEERGFRHLGAERDW